MPIMILFESMNNQEQNAYTTGRTMADEAIIRGAENGIKDSSFFYADALIACLEPETRRENLAIIAGFVECLLEVIGPVTLRNVTK